MFGCFDGEKLVAVCGYGIVRYFPTELNPSGIEGYITTVFTLEEYRNQGIMSKLFRFCMNFARDENVKHFRLLASNPVAINIYEKQGFYKYKNTYKFDFK